MNSRLDRSRLSLALIGRSIGSIGLTLLCASWAVGQTPPPPQTPPATPPKATPPAQTPPPAATPAQTPAVPPAQTPPAAPKPPAAVPPATTSPTAAQPTLPPTVDFRKGVLYGRVLDIDGKPVPDATVALQEANGKVLTWTKTNAQGEYALAADPMTALHLRPSARRGLLEACARAVGDVAMAPVKVVGDAVVNPGKTIKNVAVSVATGTPAPLAAQAIAPVVGNKSAPDQTAKQARDVAVRTAAGEGPAPRGKKPTVEKGEAQLIVSAPNFKEAKATAGAFWMECACLEKKEKPLGMQAWLEAIKLAPVVGDKKSGAAQEALTLTEPVLEPALVPAGGSVKLKVKLLSPPGPEHKVRIFAREARKDTVVELLPQEGADKSIYTGTLNVDPGVPAGETVITIAGLRAEPVEVKLNSKKADPLQEFVRRLDDMRPDKPYQYDPRIMASENRLDLKVTVLDAKKGTPTADPTPAKK